MSINRQRLLVALVAVVAFARVLGAVDFIRDDLYIIAENPLLKSLPGLFKLWTVGYWEAVDGSGTSVGIYRPLTMLTFFLDMRLLGARPGMMHLPNLALHAASAILALGLFRRWTSADQAFWSALVFAAMPIHLEAVASLVGRAELLAAVWILVAWELLDAEDWPLRRRALLLGTASYGLAMLSKEPAILFPAVLAIGDRVRHGAWPWLRCRWRGHALLSAAAGLSLVVRAVVLGDVLRGGADYFAGVGRLSRCLTTARFWLESYVWPSVSGFGLANDFSRPLIPDARPSDPWAWGCLLVTAGGLALAAVALVRRRSWGVWPWLAFIFLLPTSHLISPLDTLGAQRYFYLPSLGVALGLGVCLAGLAPEGPRILGKARLGALAAAVIVLFWTARSVSASGVWLSRLRYSQDVLAKHPRSSGGWFALSGAHLARGEREKAEAALERALELDPNSWGAAFNLGKMRWEAGRRVEAVRLFEHALASHPRAVDVMSSLALAAEAKGDAARAEGLYRRGLSIQPFNPVARYNLGLLLWRSGRRAEAAAELERFLLYFPDDPDAPAVRALLRAG